MKEIERKRKLIVAVNIRKKKKVIEETDRNET